MFLLKSKARKKVGLVLGSGGFRGFAHIGVIQVLQENKIPIDFISGASIGSLVGSYFSVFSDLNKLEEEIVMNRKEKLLTLFDFGFQGGLMSGKKFEGFLERMLGHKSFNDCHIPLGVVATDLKNGQPVVLNQGYLKTAVRASSSIPLVFDPVKYKGHLLVDGGLSNPIPVDVVKKMGAEIIIAVNLYHNNECVEQTINMKNIAIRSARTALYNLARFSVKGADIILNPDTSAFIQDNSYKQYFDPITAKSLIEIGRLEATRCLPEIKKILDLK
jgi:NTE family protein